MRVYKGGKTQIEGRSRSTLSTWCFLCSNSASHQKLVNDSNVEGNSSLGDIRRQEEKFPGIPHVLKLVALSGYVFLVDQVDEGPVVAIIATLELGVAKLEDVFSFKDKILELTEKGLEDVEGKFIRLDVSVKTFTG